MHISCTELLCYTVLHFYHGLILGRKLSSTSSGHPMKSHSISIFWTTFDSQHIRGFLLEFIYLPQKLSRCPVVGISSPTAHRTNI
jgi:hypothetical protein